MKKLIVVAAMAIAMVGCSKDEATKPAQPQNAVAQGLSVEEQVANVIKKADPKLYTKVYGENPNAKGPKDEVHYLPGVFYIPQNPWAGGIDNATCLGTNNVCMVIVNSPKSAEGSIAAITGNLDETFDGSTAQLILNNGDAPVIQPLHGLKVTMDNGVNISFN